jgi:GTP cyclohydrolase FolE2
MVVERTGLVGKEVDVIIRHYSLDVYDFPDRVRKILDVPDLSALHELMTVPEDRASDQDTPAHGLFYAGFDELAEWYQAFLRDEIAPLFAEPVYAQRVPTFRVSLPYGTAVARYHRDAEYHHQLGTINFWLPLTRAFDTNTIWVESKPRWEDYRPVSLLPGQVLQFDAVALRHGNQRNETGRTRVSFDFRVIPRSRYRSTGLRTVNSGIPLEPGQYYTAVSARPARYSNHPSTIKSKGLSMTALRTDLPDLHSQAPTVAAPVESVGHVGVRRLVCLADTGRPVMIVMDISVGLRAEQRGAHMSRLIECTNTLVQPTDVRHYITMVFNELRRLTPAAASWQVACRASMTVPVDGGIKPIEEICELSAAGQETVVRWGAAFKVCLACPQAQIAIAHDNDDLDNRAAHPSHNQLCELEIVLTGDADVAIGQTVEGLLAAGEQAASGPVRELYKRRDEADAVAAVHRHALFAEDALRNITDKLRADNPSAAQISAQIVNFESIFEYPLRCTVVR